MGPWAMTLMGSHEWVSARFRALIADIRKLFGNCCATLPVERYSLGSNLVCLAALVT